MKPSGIEWIGDIPDDWEVRKLLSLFKEHKDRNKNLEEQNLLSLSYGKIKRKDINNNDGLLPASFETYNIVEKGDIVFRLTDLQNDKRSLRTGIVTQRGIITSAYVTIRPKIKLDSRFYHYLYHMYDICKVFYGMGDGVRQGMGFEELKNIPTLIPPLKTQQKIADYLDEKCGEIDATIAKQKESIEKLKAYKQSLISETVTKGLDKSAPLKPSGIEWIGDIPNDWEICKLKRCLTIQNGLDYKSVRDDNGEFPVIGSGGQFDFASNYLYDGESVLFGRKGTINKPLYVNGKFWTVDTMFYSMIKPNACGKFIFYSATTIPFDFYSTATAVPSMTQRDLINHYLVLPPLSKQRIIADYLDSKCSQIDKYITEKQNIIQKLDAYKKSLIFEYVTGKHYFI